ncbi:MAG: D-cysteine desulfhydrase [Pseudonocardiaceae bacterium]|nr:D-cysteine desulfhydrase [Pseudonocardiaceae bacterium]
MHLARFPRRSLGHFPTALEPMHRLTAHLREHGKAPNLWVKRDDCTGLATGGNKTRKLEFLVGDAVAHRADVLITQGATQSNHVRQTAAAAAIAGMRCEIFLESRVERDEEYELSGNVLLDRILGAVVTARLPAGSDMRQAMEQRAAELRREGLVPYVIPGGGSIPVGALGYVACAMELATAPARIDCVVHATGSAGTQGGLVAGLWGSRTDIPVLGISVRAAEQEQRSTVHELAVATLRHLGIFDALPRDVIEVDDRFVGGGYGVPTKEMRDAIELVARTEGILLDPVYSGKAMAGLLTLVGEGRFAADDNVVFVHTGGVAALFGYRSVFE